MLDIASASKGFRKFETSDLRFVRINETLAEGLMEKMLNLAMYFYLGSWNPRLSNG